MNLPFDLVVKGLEIDPFYLASATTALVDDSEICLKEGMTHVETIEYTRSLHPSMGFGQRIAAAKIAQEEIWVSEAMELVRGEKDPTHRGETRALLDEVCGHSNTDRILMKARAMLLRRKMR